jgi:hypothetical protein
MPQARSLYTNEDYDDYLPSSLPGNFDEGGLWLQNPGGTILACLDTEVEYCTPAERDTDRRSTGL